MKTVFEAFVEHSGSFSNCKNSDERSSWLANYGIFMLGWFAREESLPTQRAADGAYCTCEKFTIDVCTEADICGVCHKPPRR